MTIREYQEKHGRRGNWETVSVMEGERALEGLATDLAMRYIGKAPIIRKIERRNNYNGTQTYTVYYDFLPSEGRRALYTTDIY